MEAQNNRDPAKEVLRRNSSNIDARGPFDDHRNTRLIAKVVPRQLWNGSSEWRNGHHNSNAGESGRVSP
jgi:hypothetical protein